MSLSAREETETNVADTAVTRPGDNYYIFQLYKTLCKYIHLASPSSLLHTRQVDFTFIMIMIMMCHEYLSLPRRAGYGVIISGILCSLPSPYHKLKLIYMFCKLVQVRSPSVAERSVDLHCINPSSVKQSSQLILEAVGTRRR